MKIFIDSTDIEWVRRLTQTGLVDGITTNPTLMAQQGGGFKKILQELASLVEGSVSAEVVATDYEGMMAEARVLMALAPNITIKVPLTWHGLRTCKTLTTQEGRAVNVTLCFSANQALLAAKAGATYISPFLGRLDDIGMIGMDLLRDIRAIYDQYPHFTTEILGASIRHPAHVLEAAKMGVDVVTLPPQVFEKLYGHPLTDIGLETFLKDWQKTGCTII
jgi:transaldolase